MKVIYVTLILLSPSKVWQILMICCLETWNSSGQKFQSRCPTTNNCGHKSEVPRYNRQPCQQQNLLKSEKRLKFSMKRSWETKYSMNEQWCCHVPNSKHLIGYQVKRDFNKTCDWCPVARAPWWLVAVKEKNTSLEHGNPDWWNNAMTVVIVATWGECGAPQVAPLSGQFPANLVEVRPVLETHRVL